MKGSVLGRDIQGLVSMAGRGSQWAALPGLDSPYELHEVIHQCPSTLNLYLAGRRGSVHVCRMNK